MSDLETRVVDIIRQSEREGGLIVNCARTIIAMVQAESGVRVKPDRETFDAMCAMRNAINEHIPMPSLESDLLQGPENSVFCAAVAEAVIAEVARLRATLEPAPAPSVGEAAREAVAKAISTSGLTPERRPWEDLLPVSREHYRRQADAALRALAQEQKQ